MADKDGGHLEMISQYLRHVTSYPKNAVAKKDLFQTNCLTSKCCCHTLEILRVTEGGGGGGRKSCCVLGFDVLL